MAWGLGNGTCTKFPGEANAAGHALLFENHCLERYIIEKIYFLISKQNETKMHLPGKNLHRKKGSHGWSGGLPKDKSARNLGA